MAAERTREQARLRLAASTLMSLLGCRTDLPRCDDCSETATNDCVDQQGSACRLPRMPKPLYPIGTFDVLLEYAFCAAGSVEASMRRHPVDCSHV